MTAAIVLAGGRSRRFGTDKLAARMADGRSVLAHGVAAVEAIADQLVVVLAPGANRPDDLPARTGVVHDPEPDGGPLVGLAAGLEAANDELVIVIAGDMPLLEPAVLRLLVEALQQDPVVDAARLEADASTVGSVAVLPCVLRREPARRACRDAVATGDRRLRACLERLATAVVPAVEWRALDPTGRTLLDIDRQADLERIEYPG
jgi:molybdopterin-guanine dinucleotide biosynthesis protein A